MIIELECVAVNPQRIETLYDYAENIRQKALL